MGNSIGPGSSSTKLQHLVRNKYSILSSVYSVDTLRAVLTDLDGLCKDFENPDLAKSLGFKELRFGLQIVCELVDVSLQSAAVVSVPTKLLVLEALQSLLCIPQLARKAIEADGFLRLLSVLDPSSVELFIGTLGVILKVLTVLEEDNYNAIFFQTLSRLGCVQKFIIFVTHASVAGADNMLASAIVILDIVYWSFTHEHSSLVALRHTIRHAAFQHRDSLFELSRHPVRKLSYLTTMLLIKLMASEDKSTCLAIQDAALSYGAILWTLQKVVQDIGESADSTGRARPFVSSSSLCTYTVGGTSITGYNCFTFSEEDDVANIDTILPSRLLLALYCTGNATNMEMVARALPPSMVRFLFLSAEEAKREWLYIDPSLYGAAKLSLNEAPLMLVHSMLPSPVAASRGAATMGLKIFFKSSSNRSISNGSIDTGASGTDFITAEATLSQFSIKIGQTANWTLLFSALGSSVSTPRLEWNQGMLLYLRDRINVLVHNLDFSRRLKHEAWDSTFMDIKYRSFVKMPSVKGVFVDRILRELIQGTHEQYIDNPKVFAEGLLERVIVLPHSFHPQAFAGCGDQEALLCLRALYLMMLRYPLQLRDSVNLTTMYCILKRGCRFRSGATCEQDTSVDADNNICGNGGLEVNPLWIKRVCDILCVSLKRASINDIHEFSSSGALLLLFRVFSDVKVVRGLRRWRQSTSIFQQPSPVRGVGLCPPDDAIDSEDVSEAGESDNESSGNDTAGVPLEDSKSSVDAIRDRSESASSFTVLTDLTTRTSQANSIGSNNNMLFEGFEGGSLTGEQVISSAVNSLHKALTLSASMAADIDPSVSTAPSVDAPDGEPYFLSLTKLLWLCSVHGPYRPVGLPVCKEKIIEIFLRILRTREGCHLSLARSATFSRVLICSCIREDGSGDMSVKVAELLGDLVSGLMLLRKDDLSDKLPVPAIQRLSLVESSALGNVEEDSGLLGEEAPSALQGDGEGSGVDVNPDVETVGTAAATTIGAVRRRSSYRESLLLAAQGTGASSDKLWSSADAVGFLRGVIPMQFVRLCTLLSPHNIAATFNSVVNIATAELFLNSNIRLQYLTRICRELHLWFADSFGADFEPLKNFMSTSLGHQLMASSAAAAKTDAEAAIHLHGVYLSFFLSAAPGDFLGYFNPLLFTEDVVRSLDAALVEFRMTFSTNFDEEDTVASVAPRLRTKSTSFNIARSSIAEGCDATLEQVMRHLGSLSSVRKLSVFLLSLNRVFQFWNMESDVWYDIVYSRVCSCLSAAVLYLKSLFGSKNYYLGATSAFSIKETHRIAGLLEVVLAAQLLLLNSTKYLFQSGENNGDNTVGYDRVTPILGSPLSSSSLADVFSFSVQCIANIYRQWFEGLTGNASAIETGQICDCNTLGLLHALSAVGSSFMVFFFVKVENASCNLLLRVIKDNHDERISNKLLEQTEPKKVVRKASMIDSMRLINSSKKKLIDESAVNPQTTAVKNTVDIGDEFSIPCELDFTSVSGIIEGTRKYLFTYKALYTMLSCCRRNFALHSPQTCLNVMVSLKHLLQIFPYLKSAGYQSSKQDRAGLFDTTRNSVLSCFIEVVDACVSSGLHIVLLDVILRITGDNNHEVQVGERSCPGFVSPRAASLAGGEWDPSTFTGVSVLANGQLSTENQIRAPLVLSSEQTAGSGHSALFDKLVHSVSSIESYCVAAVRQSVKCDNSQPFESIDGNKHDTSRLMDIDKNYVFNAGGEDVSTARGHIASEAVSLLNTLVISSALSAAWKYEKSVSGSFSTAGSVDGTNHDSNPKNSSLNNTILRAVEEASGDVPISINNSLGQFLEQLLTPSLAYVMMTDSPTFIKILCSPRAVTRPLAIWTLDMKRIMQKIVISELEKIERYEVERPPTNDDLQSLSLYYADCHVPEALVSKDGFKSLYANVADEVTIDGVYVRLLMEPLGKDDIGARNLPKFVEEIQASLTSTQRVIGHIAQSSVDVKQRRSSVSAGNKQVLASQLKLKQKVFEYMVRLHPELGFSNLNVQDESNYF